MQMLLCAYVCMGSYIHNHYLYLLIIIFSVYLKNDLLTHLYKITLPYFYYCIKYRYLYISL